MWADAFTLNGPMTTPRRIRPAAIAWVFIGGTVGTAIRAGITAIAIPPTNLPITTALINIVGAFLLGLLLELLALRPLPGRSGTDLKLLLGTGVLGGFTTYSALAVDTVLLATGVSTAAAIGYAVGTLVLGAVATAAGIILATVISRQPSPRSSDSQR